MNPKPINLYLRDNLQKEFIEKLKIHGVICCPYVEKTNMDYTYVELTETCFLGTHPKLVLCPCTNISHLTHIKPEKVIHLSDSKWLYENINSSSEWVIWAIIKLLKDNHLNPKKISGKKVGIIGYGRIGKQVNKILNGFGCFTYYHDVNESLETLEYILKNCKIIILSLTSNEQTRNFIDYDEFKLMENKPYIINVSRGNILNASALTNAYRNEIISGFALDVVDTYSIIEKHYLQEISKNNPNIVMTKHLAGKCIEDRQKTTEYVLNEFIKRVRGVEFGS